MTRKLIVAALMIGLLGAASLVQAEESAAPDGKRGCSVGTIQGRYGYYGDLEIIANDFGIPPGPYTSVGTAHFDGEGSFLWTSSDFPGEEMTGSYELGKDCTGTVTFDFPSATGIPSSTALLIVVSRSAELFITSPAGATVSIGVWHYKRQ